MKGFEKTAIEQVDLDRGYKRALEVLERDAIDYQSFADLYGETIIAADRRYVEEREVKFAAQMTADQAEVHKLATIFEAIIHEQVELSDWLGQEAHTVKASRYDDIHHGVDSIVEFQAGNQQATHLALAIDATLQADVAEKLQRIKSEIDQAKLTRIKYFASEYLNFRGELRQVPRVVVGADSVMIQELIELWLEKDKPTLARHPFQGELIEEILLELKVFKDYANHKNQPEIAAIYERTINLMDKIKRASPSSQNRSDLQDNRWLATMKTNLQGLFKT